MSSDNPSGADNQQERLVRATGWMVGFVDGEGCFSVSRRSEPHDDVWAGRSQPSFAVVQGAVES